MTDPLKCPTCESPEPRLHPATQAEGEVTHICPDPFHGEPVGEFATESAHAVVCMLRPEEDFGSGIAQVTR